MIHRLSTALLLLALALTGNPVMAEDAFALVGGRVIDGRGGPPQVDSIVVIKGTEIVAIGPRNSTPLPAGAREIYVNGLTVMPGLIDSHVHIGGSGSGLTDPREFTETAMENSLLSYMKVGVTTVYDMAALPGLNELKARLESGDIKGPRLYGNGFGITAPGSHPIRLITELGLMDYLGPYYFQVDDVRQARKAVREIAAARTDGVKVFHSRAESGTTRFDADREKLKPDVLKAIIDEAHKRNLKVFAHIAFPSEAREFVESGGDVVVHSIHTAETGADAVLKLMAERKVAYIPTLAVFEGNYLTNPDLHFMSRLRGKVWDLFLDSINDPKSVVIRRQNIQGLRNDSRRQLEVAMANLHSALDAGVTIAMGSDAGNAGLLHGATVLRELQLMVKAGMTPMQVIVAATRNGAEVIGQGRILGTLETGKLADIIVINGDPLQDITDIGNVELVIKNGEIFYPKLLQFREALSANPNTQISGQKP